MTPRSKKPRPLTRQQKTFRDDRLFVIATEDTHAPDKYFQVFRNPRIKVQVLSTEDGLSAPEHVINRLDEFVATYTTMEEDEFWLMLDTDHWIESNHIQNFTTVCTEALKKRYQLAHSNPCFEIWLLLHHEDLTANATYQRGEEVVARLKEILGEYNKRNVNPNHFSHTSAQAAVDRAEQLDQCPGDRWPQKNGSHVYRLVKKLLPAV